MPTRFYLPSTGAAEVTPANDSWDKTTGAGAARAAVRTRISSAMATVTNTKDNTALHSALIRQYVTEPLGAQTISGHVSGAMRCIESNGALSACVAVSIRACSQDGGTIRSPALLAISNSDLYTSTTVHEMATSLTNRLLEDASEVTAIALTSCALSDGDRLVFEFGFKANSTSTTQTGGISFGDNSAADLSSTDTTITTANNPWIEFDSALVLDRSLAVSGPTQGTGAIQEPTPESTVAVSGLAATGSVEAPAAGRGLTGELASGVCGLTLPEESLAQSGVTSSSAVGALASFWSLEAPSISATASAGLIAVQEEAVLVELTGGAGLGQAETVSSLASFEVSGAEGLNAAGDLVPGEGISSVSAESSIGDLLPHDTSWKHHFWKETPITEREAPPSLP